MQVLMLLWRSNRYSFWMFWRSNRFVGFVILAHKYITLLVDNVLLVQFCNILQTLLVFMLVLVLLLRAAKR
ncbi:hypothetical protein RchiOBHm_Chr4g0425751 [Rosa chinensis]|uniref:Uncharacterized protein n=1 Tax=Rosa chinensis TaxID=74649 RepID=A0A2P6QZB2_ROSCH|nr:hypothetical protein RchiOBHm_Chr4g0425751 [Rosa chinensis]